MIYFCSQCWREISRDAKICLQCGADQEKLSKEPFVDKLIRALDHPEPETCIRVIDIIGELGIKEAIPRLNDLYCESPDVYIVKAAGIAIDKIRTKAL